MHGSLHGDKKSALVPLKYYQPTRLVTIELPNVIVTGQIFKFRPVMRSLIQTKESLP